MADGADGAGRADAADAGDAVDLAKAAEPAAAEVADAVPGRAAGLPAAPEPPGPGSPGQVPEDAVPAWAAPAQTPPTSVATPAPAFGPAPPPWANYTPPPPPERNGRRTLAITLAVVVVAAVGTAVPLALSHHGGGHPRSGPTTGAPVTTLPDTSAPATPTTSAPTTSAPDSSVPDCLTGGASDDGSDDADDSDDSTTLQDSAVTDDTLPAVLPADTPHPPVQVSPDNKRTYLKGQRVTLRWKATGGVSRISLNHNGTGWKEYGWLSTDGCSFVPAATGTYQWEVSTAGTDSGSVGSAWSEARYLAVLASAGATDPVADLADPPVPLTPADQAHVPAGRPVTLTWTTPAPQSDVVIQSPDGKWTFKPWQSGHSLTFTPTASGHYLWSVFASAGPGDPPGSSGQQRYLLVD